MRHDHVAIGAGCFVERRAVAEPECFGNVDLDVVDEIAIPDRFEQSVGEAECENVLRGFLAEEMIDPKNLFFPKNLVQGVVQRDGRC